MYNISVTDIITVSDMELSLSPHPQSLPANTIMDNAVEYELRVVIIPNRQTCVLLVINVKS